MITHVKWSNSAEFHLDEIHSFYAKKLGLNFANDLVSGIIIYADKLIDNPSIGQIEPLLNSRIRTYRYLVYKHYKILFTVHEDQNMIRIADVFDTRQNPDKMENIY